MNWRAAALAAALAVAPGAALDAAAQVQQAITAPVAVGAVEIVGNERVPDDQILAQSLIQVGDSIRAADVDRAMRRLVAMGQFSDVAIYTLSDPDDPDVPVTVRIEVAEHPMVGQIEFRGLENVRASAVRDTVGLQAGQPYRPDQAVRAEAITRRLLAEKGFQLRSISHRLEPIPERPDELALIFDVVEGNRIAITEIAFEGNEVFSDDRLRGVLGTRAEGFLWFRPGTLNEDQLRDDLRGALPAFYSSNGYIDFAVLGDSLDIDETTGKARLIIRVEEGAQYRIADFNIRGASRFASADLRQYFEQRRSGFLGGFGIGGGRDRGTQVGEVFDAVAFQDATDDVRRLYTNTGYLYAQVSPMIERVPPDETGDPGVRVTWDIQEGQPASVRRVTIRGNTFTHEDVIRSQLLMLPGDIYSEDLLIASYRRISCARLLRDADADAGDQRDGHGRRRHHVPGAGEADGVDQLRHVAGRRAGADGVPGLRPAEPVRPGQIGAPALGVRPVLEQLRGELQRSPRSPARGSAARCHCSARRTGSSRSARASGGVRARRCVSECPCRATSSAGSTSATRCRARATRTSTRTTPPASSRCRRACRARSALGLSRMALDHPMFPTVGSRQEVEAS
jgi:outer membrane protein assembly factor BamA